MNRPIKIILVVLSSILLSLGFPNFNFGFFAYFAFVPLFFAIKRCTYKEAFILFYICGLLFFGLTIFWVHHVSILGYILLILILSIFFGVFGIFFTLYALRSTLYATFLIPASWVVLEYIRSNLFTGFGWALLGYSQYLNLPIIQMADITGAYGVSFFVMMINVIIYNTLSSGLKKAMPAWVVGLLITFIVLGYGHFKLNEIKKDKDLNISLIQGNIPQDMKWEPLYKDYIFNTYISLTKDAGKERSDLIIWPETALPGFMEEKDVFNKVKDLAKNVNTYLLIGAPSLGAYEEDVMFNSAYLVSKDGEVIGRYDKLHLVPFGEYVPFGKYIDFIRNFIDKPIGDFTKGSEYTIFQLENGLRFGVLICFEDTFPGLVRNFVNKDADFMVNITNDAWFMKTSAPYQHGQPSVFRAVENRVPVVRAANTGLSCFIDRYGRIIDSVKVGNDEIFISGYKTKRIRISHYKSLYSKFGDIFTFLCIIAIMTNGIWRWLKGYL